mgnify:CR=1 FL=1
MSTTLSLPVRRLAWPVPGDTTPDAQVTREWLVTNGLGGYASGTVAGVITRRYHGVLIAALPAPFGRTVMLSHLAEQLRFRDGREVELGGREWFHQPSEGAAAAALVEFRLEGGLPIWRYQVDGTVIERRVFFTHMQNTVHVQYELLEGDPVELALRPSVNFRPQESPVSEPLGTGYEFRAVERQFEIVHPASGLPPLRMRLDAPDATFTLKGRQLENVLYPVEESRGYQARGDLWSPGFYRFTIHPHERAGFIASTEPFETMAVLTPDQAWAAEVYRRKRLVAQAVPEAREGLPAELVLAADQFIITPAGRFEDATRARASGDEVRTVIAGYHWFTDWGRDTMISLEGLTLSTGRQVEAGYILRTFAHYVRDGLIPNMFPEGEKEGLYHTADATLWFFHALHRYLAATDDRDVNRAAIQRQFQQAAFAIARDQRLDGRGVVIEAFVIRFLPAFGGDALFEITLRIDETNAHQRQAKIAGFFAMIARQNAQATRINRQRNVQAEFGGKIGNRVAGQLGVLFGKPRAFRRQTTIQRHHDAVVTTQETRVCRRRVQLGLRDAL